MTTLSVGYTNIPGFPAGSVVAKVTAVFTGQSPGNTTPVAVDVPLGATSFDVSLPPDSYSWELDNADAQGNTFGGPFTGTGTISGPTTVSLNLASGLAFP